MKFSFRLLAMMVLAVMLGVSTTGCDSGENSKHSTMPPSQPGQPEERAPGHQQPGQQSGIGSQAPLSDSELEKAAMAYAEIQEINQQLQQSVQQTQDPNERQRLQLETNRRIVQAAEKAGLDFETYNSIIRQVRMNKALNERFQKKIQNMP